MLAFGLGDWRGLMLASAALMLAVAPGTFTQPICGPTGSGSGRVPGLWFGVYGGDDAVPRQRCANGAGFAITARRRWRPDVSAGCLQRFAPGRSVAMSDGGRASRSAGFRDEVARRAPVRLEVLNRSAGRRGEGQFRHRKGLRVDSAPTAPRPPTSSARSARRFRCGAPGARTRPVGDGCSAACAARIEKVVNRLPGSRAASTLPPRRRGCATRRGWPIRRRSLRRSPGPASRRRPSPVATGAEAEAPASARREFRAELRLFWISAGTPALLLSCR